MVRCPYCGSYLKWYPKYGEFYCYDCDEYLDKETARAGPYGRKTKGHSDTYRQRYSPDENYYDYYGEKRGYGTSRSEVKKKLKPPKIQGPPEQLIPDDEPAPEEVSHIQPKKAKMPKETPYGDDQNLKLEGPGNELIPVKGALDIKTREVKGSLGPATGISMLDYHPGSRKYEFSDEDMPIRKGIKYGWDEEDAENKKGKEREKKEQKKKRSKDPEDKTPNAIKIGMAICAIIIIISILGIVYIKVAIEVEGDPETYTFKQLLEDREGIEFKSYDPGDVIIIRDEVSMRMANTTSYNGSIIMQLNRFWFSSTGYLGNINYSLDIVGDRIMNTETGELINSGDIRAGHILEIKVVIVKDLINGGEKIDQPIDTKVMGEYYVKLVGNSDI